MGQPFRVNSYQENWQRNPVIQPLPDGGFIVFWDSYLNSYEDDAPTATYVAGQQYDAAGNRVGSEFVLTGADETVSELPEVAMLPDGGIVIAWVYDDYDDILTVNTQIHAMVLNADGSLRVPDFQVDTVASFRAVRPAITVTGDGGFVISFGTDRSSTNFDQVFAQAYTAAGVAKGGNFLLNTVIQDFDQLVTRGATLADGRAVIIWNSEATISNGGAGQNDIRASILNADGSVFRADFRLKPSIGGAGDSRNYGYDVAALADGGFAMVHLRWAWDYAPDQDIDGTGILISLYDRSGNPRTGEILVHNSDEVLGDVRMTQLATGEIVVVWNQSSETPGDVGDDAYGRVLSATGVPIGPVFEIGVDLDAYTEQDNVEIAALAGGGFVVAFTDEGIDSDDDGIAARIYGRGTAGADQLTVDQSGMMAGLGGNDRLTGNARANRLDGGTGNDLLRDTAGGNDTLIGGYGNDSLQGGIGNDRLDGSAGVDTAIFTAMSAITVDLNKTGTQATGEGLDLLRGIEHVTTAGGADVLSGNAAANLLIGNGGNDRLSGRLGHDTLDGSYGNDILSGGGGDDLLQGGMGIDTVIFESTTAIRANLALTTAQATGQGSDRLLGIENMTSGGGADWLSGDGQRNALSGGAGNDTLLGQGGNDMLIGGIGNDIMAGGAGADSFLFAAGSGRDWITDFQPDIDQVRIDVANPGAPGATFTAVSTGTLVAWGSSTLLLRGIAPGQLDADDLIFI